MRNKKRPQDKRPKPRGSKTLRVVDTNPYKAVQVRLEQSRPSKGDLRLDASKEITSKLDEYDLSKFDRISRDSEQHTIIRGRDGSIYAYHVPRAWLARNNITSEYVKRLVFLLENLPPLQPSVETKNVQASRGIKYSRTYQFWIGSKKGGVLGVSAQYVKDGPKGKEFVEHCKLLWETLGQVYDNVFPNPAATLRNYQAPEGTVVEFLARPWPGMTINQGCEDEPVETNPHKDSTDAFYQNSCLYACGEFNGGDVIFWELESVLEMESGDALFVPAHLITHSNTPVTAGIRHSLVAYARQETLTKNQDIRGKKQAKRKAELIKKRNKKRKME